MGYCQNCGAKFGDGWEVFDSTCPACRREKESLRRQEEMQEEMQARRQDEDERRHKERLDAEEERYQKQLDSEEDRIFAEELRQSTEEDRYLQRKRDREDEREELLYKQRMQLANAWRYEAESKLQQAERLYQAGARREALTLAQQASVIGIDAWRLIGWIHRDDCEKGKYLEQLRVQIGVLDDCQNSAAHQERVLKEIFALADDGNDLLKIFFDAATKWQIFPSSVIALLLEKQDAKRANEVFTNASRKVPEDANNDVFVWTVCPFGIELSERGVQPHTWGKKFKNAIEKIPLSEVMTRNLKLILESTVMGAKTKAIVRETMNAKGKHILASERVDMLKQLRENKKSPDGLPWYLGSNFFATTIAGGFAYLLWETGSGAFTCIVAAIPTYIGANSLKNWSNFRHVVQIKLANWYDLRRAIVGKALHLNDSTSLKVFGATSLPSHTLLLVKNVVVMIPVLWLAHGLLGSKIAESKPVSRGLENSSIEWTRDWNVSVPNDSGQTGRLGLDPSGTPILSLFKRDPFFGVDSDPRSFVRLTNCVGTKVKVTCSATTTIISMVKYQSVPSRLELNLANGTGSIFIRPPGESELVLILRDTPSSLIDAPDWVSRKSGLES